MTLLSCPELFSIQMVSRLYIMSGTWPFLCTYGNYVPSEIIPHTLAICYPVYLPSSLLILSIVHKNDVITDFEGWIKRTSVRWRQFPFPSMETVGRKSLCIATRDQNYVLSGVNAIEDAWKVPYQRNLFANELCTHRQICIIVDADSAGTKEFLCTNV